MDRVLPSEGRGCWFDPSRARQNLKVSLGDANPDKSRPYGESRGPFSFFVPPETSFYAPFGGEGAELRIAQTQQELLNVWSRNGRNLETRQVLAR